MVKDPCRWISPIWILVFLQRVLMLKVIFIGIIITIIQWLISIFIIWPNLFVQWVMICMSLMYDERVNKRKRKKLCCSGWKKIRFWKFKTTLFRIGGPWTACQKFDLTYYRVFYLNITSAWTSWSKLKNLIRLSTQFSSSIKLELYDLCVRQTWTL